jgi:sulfhydrogenase subunit delta
MSNSSEAVARDQPRLAVFKFASCDGCQLSLLDAEDELLLLGEHVEIAYFLEATSRTLEGPYDIGIVEGSITTPHDRERIQQVRQQCRILVTIGACATAGGIQALRNWAKIEDYMAQVYATPEYLSTLSTSTAIADHVAVDFELRGCPINKSQLLDLLTSLAQGRKPRFPNHSVCVECKLRGNLCLAVAQGVACLGPITQAGCEALCPTFGRGCFGCYGPKELANAKSLCDQYQKEGTTGPQLVQLLRSFNANATEFRQASEGLARESTGHTETE